jgi:hypothetical protein
MSAVCFHPLLAVTRLGDEAHVGLATDDRRQAIANQRMVVDGQNRDRGFGPHVR